MATPQQKLMLQTEVVEKESLCNLKKVFKTMYRFLPYILCLSFQVLLLLCRDYLPLHQQKMERVST